jgi:hypothetical protein
MMRMSRLTSRLKREMSAHLDSGCDAVSGSGVSSRTGSPGIRLEIPPRPVNPRLDHTWVLLGVTGYHP